jgi:hypothetical protein
VDTVARQRQAFVFLAVLATVGTTIELATERHWGQGVQLIPWGSVALLVLGLVVLWRGRSVRLVRGTAVVVALSGVVGVYEHVLENFHAGPLDYRYTDRWTTMTTLSKWWTAISKTAGPAPTLAPAVLVLAALCLAFATIGRSPD